MANELPDDLRLTQPEAEVVAKTRGIAVTDVEVNVTAQDGGMLVNELQSILETSRLGPMLLFDSREDIKTFRRRAIRLLVKISRHFTIFPEILFLEGVICDGKLDPKSRGGYADIFQGKISDELVAVKRLRTYESEEERKNVQDMLRKEAILWLQLEHPHILPLLGIDDKTFAPLCSIVSPWMLNGNLFIFVQKNASTSSQINDWVGQAAKGLEYLHEQDIVHGDLRAANVLINDVGQACLSDFGLAHVYSATSAAGSTDVHQRNVRWLAPEMIVGCDIIASTKGDVFALGRVCLEVYTLKKPFWYIAHDAAVTSKIIQGEDVRRPTPEEMHPRDLSDQKWEILQLCWKRNDVNRLSATEFIASWKT